MPNNFVLRRKTVDDYVYICKPEPEETLVHKILWVSTTVLVFGTIGVLLAL